MTATIPDTAPPALARVGIDNLNVTFPRSAAP